MPHYKFSDLAYNITDKKMPEPGDEKTYIGLEHLDSGSLAVTRWGGEIELKGQKLVMKKGDILFGRRNTYLRRAAIAPHDGIFSAHGMIFRPKTEVIDPDYFPFFIASDYFMNAAIRISVGSLSPTVNWKTLKELEFDIPTLEEQRESAKILKAANELKESYQVLLKKTDDLVKSQFIEMFGDPFENEKRLLIEPLSKHIELLGGFAFKSTGFVKEGIPVLRIGNINAGYFKPDDLPFWEYDEALDRYLLYPGDLVISLTGTVGKDDYGNVCRLGDDYPMYYLNQRNAKLILKDTVLPEYITALLKNRKVKDRIANAGVGVRQANISNKTILELEVPVPEIEAQIQFASFVKQSDKSKFELKQAIEGVDVLIKSLIQQELN